MRRQRVIIGAVLAFVVAAVLGAVGNWFWWLPYEGIVIPIVAGVILLIALILGVVRRTRAAGLVALALGAGLIAGQALGPSRPPLDRYSGTLTVTISAPQAATGSQPASCVMDASGADLQVGGDSDVRLDILPDDPSIPADIDQREFFIVGLTVGDRWRQGATPRPDGINLTIIVGQVRADIPETRLASAPSSTLHLERSKTGGTLSFAGLIPEPGPDQPVADPLDLVGTLAWTCEDRPPTEPG